MPGMIEVAKATVTIIPNMEGSQRTITEDLTGVASSAGTKAGAAAGTNMAKGIGKAIAGTAIAAKVGKGIADSWKEVDSAMDTVAVKTGATGAALDELGDSMKKVASSIPTDFEKAGDAVGEVNTKFQVTGEELETLSAQFVKFATINNSDVSDSVDTVANTLAAFGQDASSASDVLDAMNAAGQATGIGMEELGNALQKNAPAFKQMGMSAQDAAGLMATFNAAGVTTADTSIALRTALKVASKEGITMSEAIANFGDTMRSTAPETVKLQHAMLLFGSKAGASIYNAFANGKISAEDFAAAMADVSGNVSSTFEATLDPTDRFQQAMNGLKTIGAELVEAMAPAFNTIANVAIPAIQAAAEGFSALPDGVKTAIVAFAGVVAVAGPLSSIGGTISGAFKGLGGIFSGIGGAASSAASGLGTIGSSAASAATGAASAAGGFGAMAGAALKIVALGAAFALVGAGLKLMADGAVAIGQGGLPAAAAMLEMVAAVAALMGVAALLGPALTAGALGIGVFGAAILAIGAGIGLATLGISKLVDSISNLMEKSKAGGEGMNLLAEGVSKIVALNLADLAISMAAVSSGIGKLGKHSEELTATATAVTDLGTSLTGFGVITTTVLPAFETMMNSALVTVQKNLAEMSELFKNTKFEFGAIKLPHFKMSGNFDAKSGKVPTVSVDWYAQAAEKGALFTSPQIIGVGDSSQPEMLIGEKTLQDKLAEAVGNNNGGDVYVYIGDTQLDAIIQRSAKRTAMRSGGH